MKTRKFQVKKVPTEKFEQICLMKWASTQPIVKELLLHIANEYDGGVQGGYQRKLMGVKKGVSDVFMPLPTKLHHGLWIELKRRVGGKVTEEQKAWLDLMNKLNYSAHIAYGYEQAMNIVRNYMDEGLEDGQAENFCK